LLVLRHTGPVGKAKRNRQKRTASSLAEHRRHKKTLTPPMMTLPNLRQTRWQHERLPDFVWLQAIREETGGLPPANDALDILDPFVPDPQKDTPRPQPATDGHPLPAPIDYLDGRISTFALVPERQRGPAREALSTCARWALPDGLGHALALYPDCPAAWLYEDWAREHHADPEIGIAYLKRLVVAIYDPCGRPSSQLRLMPLARMIKHGKLYFAEGMKITELLPDYPTRLSTADQLHVEQWARATSLTRLASEDSTIAQTWVTYFWRHSYEIAPCEEPPTQPPAPEEHDEQDDGQMPREPPRERSAPASLAEVRRRLFAAVDELGQGLQVLQQQATLDTHETTADEIKLGLASRQFRLLRRLIADPSLWNNEMAPHMLRSMIDVRIILAWLIKQDDLQLFERFKAYGQGKRKLFKLKLEDLMESEKVSFDEDDRAFLDRMREKVNQDTMEEFQTIDLGGSFSGKNIREMAKETDLADLYSLNYQPLSTEAHGEWGSLLDFDLRHCGNPLHKYHRLGRFDTSPAEHAHLGWIRDAFMIAGESIEEVFDSYRLDSQKLFSDCQAKMAQA
jgi:hypothetical protein